MPRPLTLPSTTPELIRSALAHIPANIVRDEWARVGMAIKSEFPDQTGSDLFTEWSATADSFDANAVKVTWRNIKAVGGVAIGTLFHLAKENGFVMPKSDQAPSKPDPEAVAKREREKADSRQREQARIDADHARAAAESLALWEQASEPSEAPTLAPYLVRKGVQPYGVRVAPGGWLLVPLRDESGTLWNVQRIAPAKPADGAPEKLFTKGGRKSGCWHWCGDPAGAPVLLAAEGYATAASIHQATGYPVAVAFDAGNLAHVAKTLRQLYPAALLVLCGDDDLSTFALRGFNPGRSKAEACARAVRGLAVFPQFKTA